MFMFVVVGDVTTVWMQGGTAYVYICIVVSDVTTVWTEDGTAYVYVFSAG